MRSPCISPDPPFLVFVRFHCLCRFEIFLGLLALLLLIFQRFYRLNEDVVCYFSGVPCVHSSNNHNNDNNKMKKKTSKGGSGSTHWNFRRRQGRSPRSTKKLSHPPSPTKFWVKTGNTMLTELLFVAQTICLSNIKAIPLTMGVQGHIQRQEAILVETCYFFLQNLMEGGGLCTPNLTVSNIRIDRC